MAFVITQPCIDTRDKACVSVCPVDCIHFEEGSDRMLYINPAECIDCGACQPACPVSAIFPESGVPDDMKQFVEINSLWYSDPAAARARVGGAPAGAAPAAAAATSDAPKPAPKAAEPEPAAGGYIPPELREKRDGFKWGENGVEGKCALCGQYVIKGGTKFRARSVLCSDCAERQARIGNPYGASAGRR